jgi:16S rRNA G966 N2-methylase RsmD
MNFEVFIKQLQSEKAKSFIEQHLKDDTNALRLKYHAKKEFPYLECIDQIEAKQRLKKKNPTWANNKLLVFPPKLNVEQSSSEATSKYKAKLVKGERFIDLTGGMGIDSVAFSDSFKSGVYCELSDLLCQYSEHNFKTLKANITIQNKNGFEVLRASSLPYDVVYIDPARRIEGKRMVSLKDCEPDITQELDLVFSKSQLLLIKTSPLLDISKVISEIPFVKEVHVVSVNNECKELLFLCQKGYQEQPKIFAVNITPNSTEVLFSSSFKHTQRYSLPKTFLLEPNASIMKAALFNELSEINNLSKLHRNSHLFTSNKKPEKFPGKIFRILEIQPPFRKSLKGETLNIVSRNFGLKPEQIKKKLKTKDGGARFLFATTLNDNKKAFILCEKID